MALLAAAPAFGLVDDRNMTIATPKDVEDKRAALIAFIWGSDGFPSTKLPSSVASNVPDPAGVPALERVDELRISMANGFEAVAHHFIPTAGKRNELVIVHSGHWCGLDRAMIGALLEEGYSVLGMYMPHQSPIDCRAWPPHADIFDVQTTGSPMKFYLEPVAVSLNYLATAHASGGFPRYSSFHMTGLSGGGWATSVYAAIDSRIKYSAPVAGSIPLYLRYRDSVGDLEQTLDAFYQIAGYPDLYVMGSYGAGRRQTQILNRRDNCCFGEEDHDALLAGMSYDEAMRTYEKQVRRSLHDLGAGAYRLEIDEAAVSHQVSDNAIWNIILSDLNHDRRLAGAATKADAFVRGMNGNLWHRSPNGWYDTKLEIIGVPAVLRGVAHDFDLFYRDPTNQLRHAYPTWLGWTATAVAGPALITDPVATSWGPGRFDLTAIDLDFGLQHWWSTGGVINRESIATAAGLGTPAITSSGPNRVDVFFRARSGGAVMHAASAGSAPWTVDGIGGVIRGFPAVTSTGGDTLRVFARGQGGGLWQASQVAGGPWRWGAIPGEPMSQVSLSGSPGVSIECSILRVHARTLRGNVASFVLSRQSGAGSIVEPVEVWDVARHGGVITGSPTSVPGGAFVRGSSGGLYLHETTDCLRSKGGLLD